MTNKSSNKAASIFGKDDLLKVISSLATIFVLMGIFKAGIYYLIFDINILEYAEWNEYLFFFLSDINDLLYLVILFFIAFSITSYINKLEVINENQSEKYYNIFVIGTLSILALGSISISVGFLRRLLFKGIGGEIIIYAICFGLLLLLSSFYYSGDFLFEPKWDMNDAKKKVAKTKALKTWTIIILVIGVIFILNIAPPYLKAYRLINSPDKRKELSIYNKGVIIKETSDSVLYVGKTGKFFFFFDMKLKKSWILNTSYVDSVRILRKPFKGSYKPYDPIK